MFGLTPYERRNYDLFNSFNDFEKEFFGERATNPLKIDVREEDGKYVLEAEMPGFNKDNIKLDIDGDYLVLTAEQSAEKEEKNKNGKYIRRERSYGSYRRSFDISNVDASGIAAEYKDGILTLDMPKKAPAQLKARSIEIK